MYESTDIKYKEHCYASKLSEAIIERNNKNNFQWSF